MFRLIKLLIIYVLCFCSIKSYSQSTNISTKIDFCNYLISSQQYDDALFFIEKIQIDTFTNLSIKDTLYYQRGLTKYYKKMLRSSAIDFLKVSETSGYYLKSRFFASNNLAYENSIDTAIKILSNLKLNNTNLDEFRTFELSGMYLLLNDTARFRNYSNNYTYNDNRFTNEEKNLLKYYDKGLKFKHKSPTIAGLMSAIVPGSGKYYAGYKGQGFAAFTTVAALGAMTVENYIKVGVYNFKTIFFGSLFCIFYTGNIYGSIVSVQLKEKQFNESQNYQILFDLHIPLRIVFY